MRVATMYLCQEISPQSTQKAPSQLKVAPKVEGGDDGGGHYFAVGHLALWVFRMMQGFQHIVTQAKDCYNLSVHAILRPSFGLVTVNCTRVRMDIAIHSPQGSNWGYIIHGR